ncbi:MAG: glycosyltransferase family 9 protein [Spirochaetia bacterium]|nr:glycosyltransferase family 9 protein [Spirochaetia bacterium]
MAFFSRYGYRNPLFRMAAGLIDLFGSVFFFWMRRDFSKEKNLTSKVKSILVVKLDHLGDAFLLTPLFEALKKKFPQAVITCLCLPASRPIFENNPFIDQILTFRYQRSMRSTSETPEPIRKMLRLFREQKPNLLIDPRGDFWVAVYGFLAAARRRVGFRAEEPGSFLFHQTLPLIPGEPEAMRNLRLPGLFGGEVVHSFPKIHATPEEVEALRASTETQTGRILLGVHPGAGFPYKKWPLERTAALLKRVHIHFPETRIFVFGEKKERGECEDLIHQSGISTPSISNEAGKWTLRETYVFVGKMNAFFGNDSVLAHFCAGQNVPVLELMNAAVDASRWHACGDGTEWLVGRDPEHRCALNECVYPCPHMVSLDLDSVWNSFRAILENARVAVKERPQ